MPTNPYIKGQGNPSAKLMIVGDMPTPADEITKQPFSGQGGKLLDEMLRDSGFSRSDCYLTNVLKYRIPHFKMTPKFLKEEGLDLDKETIHFKEEVSAIKPNAILALGDLALFSTLGIRGGISNWRGSILRANFQYRDDQGNLTHPKVIPSFPPDSLLFSKSKTFKAPWSAKAYMILDYKRAWAQAQFSAYNPPERDIEICKSSYQLKRYLEKYEKTDLFAYDIESIKCIPVLLGLAASPKHAISIPLTNFHGIDLPYSELAQMWLLCQEFFDRKNLKLVGQNLKYDQGKLEDTCGFRIPKPHADIMFMMSEVYAELDKDLGFMASIFTEEPYYKNAGKEYNPKKDRPEVFMVYNGKDCCVTLEIYNELEELLAHYGLRERFYNDIMPRHSFFMEMERNGFPLSRDKQKFLIQKYTAWEDEIESELRALTGINDNHHETKNGACFYNSPQKVANLLYNTLGIPERAGTDEDTLCALLANTVTDFRLRTIIDDIYKLRRVRKAKKSIAAEPDYDGKQRTSVRITGTETGRRSTSALATQQKKVLRPTACGFASQTVTKHGEFGADIRIIYEAAPGYCFVQGDSSQAEARIVALLAGDYELLELFNTIDVHCLTTSWLFGKTLEQCMKDKAEGREDERFVGKTARHAGNYGMAKRRLALDVTSNARRFGIKDPKTGQLLSLSESKADQILRIFHSKSPKIRGEFHENVKKLLKDNKRVLVNPFGRRRLFLDRWGDDLFREAFAQIPQSTVGDNTIGAALRIKRRKPDLKFILESHDALLVMAKEEEKWEAARLIKEELERPIDFERCSISRGKLVIPADIEMGYNYKELKKVKQWPTEAKAS